ncbi:MAG: protein-tyrosine phosphatase family protein, partial [Verrucomicrobiota bacterium]
VVAHCRAGIGRSSLCAAALLSHFGISGDESLKLIANARGLSIPDTQEQRDFIIGYDTKTLKNKPVDITPES